MKNKTIGYLRVSTEKQDTQKWEHEIKKYCQYKELDNLEFVHEKVSGMKKWQERLLHNILDDDDVKNIVVPELSRIGRTAIQIYQVVEKTREKGINIYVIKENFEITEKDDMKTIIMLNTFSMIAEIERQLISERTKEALQERKRQGTKLGRKKGKKVGSKLDRHRLEIIDLLKNKVSKSEIARRYNVSRLTIYNFIDSLTQKEKDEIKQYHINYED